MIFLMYHELQTPGRSLCQNAPGYVRYVIGAEDFRSQMKSLSDMGWRGANVSEALRFAPKTVAITFDDGCESDLLTAAPILGDFGFAATFYVTTGFIGRPGYLSENQLRELSSLDYEIGCHAMTHAYLSDLDEHGLRREIIESKCRLEQIIGKPVQHFSCPGGRYDGRSIEMARIADYRSFATSRIHTNSKRNDGFVLGRIAIMRGTTLRDFQGYCQGRGLWRLAIEESLRQTAKSVLGNSLYDRLRAETLQKAKRSS